MVVAHTNHFMHDPQFVILQFLHYIIDYTNNNNESYYYSYITATIVNIIHITCLQVCLQNWVCDQHSRALTIGKFCLTSSSLVDFLAFQMAVHLDDFNNV
jgi:hypothetical protein